MFGFKNTFAAIALSVAALGATLPTQAHAQGATLEDLGRFDGWRENPLVGYGIVVGLSGTGDSRRSGVTRQTLQNVLSRLGVNVSEEDINSRNAAIVTVTAKLPPSANVGDRLSVTVSSMGDARSLAGGTLLMTPLLGPDRKTYGLAQGPLVAGGYAFESEANFQQRNFPTTARIEMGATVERPVRADLVDANGYVSYLLDEPDFGLANRVANAVNRHFKAGLAVADTADRVYIKFDRPDGALTGFLATIEALRVDPGNAARIVINERTGTIVAGADVKLSPVVVSQGDIKVTVVADNYASQPAFISGFATDVQSLVVRNTELYVEQGRGDVVAEYGNSTVADLVQGLSEAGVDTRRLIVILQALKSAGALHSEIVVQ